jgi:hypothetical protein
LTARDLMKKNQIFQFADLASKILLVLSIDDMANKMLDKELDKELDKGLDKELDKGLIKA